MTFGQYAVSGLAALGLLSGCGGGGLDAAPDNTPTIAAALTAASQAGRVGSQSEALRAANTLLPLLRDDGTSPAGSAASRDSTAKASPWRSASVAGASRAKSSASAEPKAACSGSGTSSASTQDNFNANSPYTSQRFSMNLTTDDECKESLSAGGETLTVTSRGLLAAGQITESGRRVVHQRIGQFEPTVIPYREVVERSYPLNGRTVTDTLLLELSGLAHERYYSTGELSEREHYFRAQGQASAYDDQGRPFEGTFVVQQGVSTTNRFRVGATRAGAITAVGSLSVGLVAKPASVTSNCGSGTYTISTPAPLTNSNGVLQGTLSITSNGQTATYVFSSDGGVEITAGDGSKQSLTQSVFNDDCAVF